MFHLAHPIYLIALPLPLLVYYILPKVPSARRVALRIPFYRQTSHLSGKMKIGQTHWIVYLVWMLLIVALCAPEKTTSNRLLPRVGRNIMMALDISGSMQIKDMTSSGTTRLSLVKQAARRFIQQRTHDRLGLIVFGSQAYLQAPLTFDHQTILALLEDASVGLAGPQTALGDAMGLAIKRLQSMAEGPRVLIVLTDGANNRGKLTPLQAAHIASRHHIKVYTIGIGAAPENARHWKGGSLLNTDLDQKTLKAIAHITRGAFFLASDADQLRQAYRSIDQLEPARIGHVHLRIRFFYYEIPLLIALLLSFVWAWKRLRTTL